MRLREPFAGYKLTSGHYMFHLAFLIGTYLPLDFYSDQDQYKNIENTEFVFKSLRFAHIMVPLLDLCAFMSYCNSYFHLEKVFDTLTIFLY
jgi:hypothetical protein